MGLLLAKRVAPRVPGVGSTDMGWRWRDAAYYGRIPPEARQVPVDWSQLPVVRFENTQLGGVREVRLRETHHYDQWLLNDSKHKLRACISIERSTRRVYFFEIKPDGKGSFRRDASTDNCYSCHPSGPRVIRTFPRPPADERILIAFNRRILSYSACDFWGSEVTRWRGKPWPDPRCAGCHNGVDRGRLYAIHRTAIRFKLDEEQSMPPAFTAPQPRSLAPSLPRTEGQDGAGLAGDSHVFGACGRVSPHGLRLVR